MAMEPRNLEAEMKKLFSLVGLGSLSTALILAVVPAWADSVDQKIKSLEDELTRLKGEQMELRKEATAAAAAMPTFNYRPGGGLTIAAGDQSWGIRFRYLFHIDMTWLEGQDARRNGDFELFGRRNRPEFTYFWDRGFYEFRSELDMDAGDATEIQRATLFIHYEKLNPWFPTFQVGMDNPGTINEYDRGSNRTAATAEFPLVRRDNGWNTGSHTGVGLVWDKLPAMLVPGTWDFHYYWIINGLGRGDGDTDQSSNMDQAVYFNMNPFSQSKNKWLSGFAASLGVWFGNPDERNTTNSSRRLRLRTALGPNRVTLFDSGNDIDRGLHTFISPGLQYQVSPYKLMVSGGFDRWNSNDRSSKAGRPGEVGRIQGTYWKLINELFIWSPKGLLTGSPITPNSLLMGWSFERAEAECGRPNCDETVTAGGAQFRRNRILVRELDFSYFFRPALSLLLAWRWYDASNVPTTSQPALGCRRNNATAAGKDCDWSDVVLRLRWAF